MVKENNFEVFLPGTGMIVIHYSYLGDNVLDAEMLPFYLKGYPSHIVAMINEVTSHELYQLACTHHLKVVKAKDYHHEH